MVYVKIVCEIIYYVNLSQKATSKFNFEYTYQPLYFVLTIILTK